MLLAPTRWKLRRAIRVMNETLSELKLAQHPDKTFIGRISRGFDFLGYRFQSEGLIGVARQTVERFVERVNRLYEQGADAIRIDEYVRRWWKWVRGGLGKFSALVKAESAFDGCSEFWPPFNVKGALKGSRHLFRSATMPQESVKYQELTPFPSYPKEKPSPPSCVTVRVQQLRKSSGPTTPVRG